MVKKNKELMMFAVAVLAVIVIVLTISTQGPYALRDGRVDFHEGNIAVERTKPYIAEVYPEIEGLDGFDLNNDWDAVTNYFLGNRQVSNKALQAFHENTRGQVLKSIGVFFAGPATGANTPVIGWFDMDEQKLYVGQVTYKGRIRYGLLSWTEDADSQFNFKKIEVKMGRYVDEKDWEDR